MPVGVQQGGARRVIITPIKNTFQKLQKRYGGHTGRAVRDVFIATTAIAGTAIGIQAVRSGTRQGKKVSFDFLTRRFHSPDTEFFERVTSQGKRFQNWLGRLGERKKAGKPVDTSNPTSGSHKPTITGPKLNETTAQGTNETPSIPPLRKEATGAPAFQEPGGTVAYPTMAKEDSIWKRWKDSLFGEDPVGVGRTPEEAAIWLNLIKKP
ncbi:MAG TPA: hypothetical protein V6C99_00145 [Oculatellaceae cyanobacterium]